MQNHAFDPESFFKTACYFEGSLILVALILGQMANIDPFTNLYFSEKSLSTGIFATAPLLIIFFGLQDLTLPPLRKIKFLLLETIGASLCRRHWTDLFILAGIAGLSEESLFRGFLQPWLENSWSSTSALIASNLVFGLVHAVTPLYAIMATLIGLYLGISLDFQSERNLLIPIIIHSLYDFVVFMAIRRNFHNLT